MADITLTVPALDKLLDYVASGVGAIAGPLLAPWRASQEGKARVNTAKADVDVQRIKAAAESSTSQLIAKEQAEARKYVATSNKSESDGDVIRLNDVQKAMEFQAKKRMMNVGALVGYGAEELGDTEVPNHDPDPDWTARFFDCAQDVSSEYLQRLWGQILAGEVKSPGQTSLRTLSILRDMTQQEARDFSKLMRFRIANLVFDDSSERMLGEDSDLIVHLSHIGLFGRYGEIERIVLGDNGKWMVEHYGYNLIIEGQSGWEFQMITIDIDRLAPHLITVAGMELAKLCKHKPDLQYLSHFAKFLARQKCTLKLAKIVSQDAKGYQTCDERIIRPFGEPEECKQEESNNGE